MYAIALIGGLGGVLAIVMALWIYNDAEIHGQDGLLWAILVFFLGIPALIVYFLFFRQGIAPSRQHKAVNRNEDFLIRGRYLSRAGGKAPGYTTKSTPEASGSGASDFSDPELERLIAAGKLSQARGHLKDMLEIAREVNDRKTMQGYQAYHSRIARAAARPGGGLTSKI